MVSPVPQGTEVRRGETGLVRGATFSLLSEASILPAGLVSAAILTRGLGVAGYGWLGVTFALVGPIAWAFASIIAGRTAVKLILDTTDRTAMMSYLLRLNVLIGAAGWAIFALCAPLIARAVGNPDLTLTIALVGSEILLLPLARVHRDFLTTQGHYSRSGISTGVFQMSRLLMIAVLIPLGFGITAVVFAVAGARITEILWCRARLSVSPFLPGAGLQIPWRATVGVLFLYEFCNQIILRHDIVLLSALGNSTEEVGFYAAARIVAMAPELFALALVPMLIAAMVDARNRRRGALMHMILDRSDQVSALMAGLMLATVGASVSICTLLFGRAFASAAPIYALLAVGAGAAFVQALTVAHLVARDRYLVLALLMVPILLGTILLNVLVIPRFGAVGAAAVMAIMRGLSASVALWALPRPRGARVRTIALGLACGVIGALAGYAVSRVAFPGLDLLVATGVTAGLMMLSGLVKNTDIVQFLREMRRTGRGTLADSAHGGEGSSAKQP